LTGHLVFSTLHTNDAPGALTRLVDMGIEPYLVASSLEAVLAQRLVRLLCTGCREELPPRDAERARRTYHLDALTNLYGGRGCRRCLGTGYRGRSGIFELMVVTDKIRARILERAASGEVRVVAQRGGMKSLREDGWRLVIEGRTTLEEVLRVTKDERLAGDAAARATAPDGPATTPGSSGKN
jgi:type II secretory ATPase GspE/PulE/Tfp pilus assembly ATPase PilB-like protein